MEEQSESQSDRDVNSDGYQSKRSVLSRVNSINSRGSNLNPTRSDPSNQLWLTKIKGPQPRVRCRDLIRAIKLGKENI